MIGFVTWPPFSTYIVVKMPCKLLYVIQVKGFLIKGLTSWHYLITIAASDWSRTFLQPGCFCLGIHIYVVTLNYISNTNSTLLLYIHNNM